jgi:hypothetical protein
MNISIEHSVPKVGHQGQDSIDRTPTIFFDPKHTLKCIIKLCLFLLLISIKKRKESGKREGECQTFVRAPGIHL